MCASCVVRERDRVRARDAKNKQDAIFDAADDDGLLITDVLRREG